MISSRYASKTLSSDLSFALTPILKNEMFENLNLLKIYFIKEYINKNKSSALAKDKCLYLRNLQVLHADLGIAK